MNGISVLLQSRILRGVAVACLERELNSMKTASCSFTPGIVIYLFTRDGRFVRREFSVFLLLFVQLLGASDVRLSYYFVPCSANTEI